MGYRWINVDVVHGEDGGVLVTFEGRGELSISDTVWLEEGETACTHVLFEGQPEKVEWSFDKYEGRGA